MDKLTKVELMKKCKEINIKVSSNIKKAEIIKKLEESKSLKFIDLFCGIGVFHQALRKLGGTCVFASDIDKNCQDIYEENYGIRPHGDIKEVNINDIPDFDILTGGFPC